MYTMVQKSSYEKTLEIFFTEPTNIHFIKEISRKTKIAPTSIRKNIGLLLKENLITRKEAKPFSGYVANRNNEKFIFFKKIYNLSTLYELTEYIKTNVFPPLFLVFGSYSIGEDIENSDIDLFMVSKSKKIDVKKFEKKLKREINLLVVDNLNKIEKPLLNKIYNGIVLCGGFDE
jgi:predicted nucleotidyltransferase